MANVAAAVVRTVLAIAVIGAGIYAGNVMMARWPIKTSNNFGPQQAKR